MKLEIEVEPDNALSKNNLHKIRTQGAAEKVREITKKERTDGGFLALEAMQIAGGWEIANTVNIKVTQYYSNKPFDYDGLACVVSPFIDGLSDAGVMRDDNPKVVKNYSMESVKVKTRPESKTIIEVERLS